MEQVSFKGSKNPCSRWRFSGHNRACTVCKLILLAQPSKLSPHAKFNSLSNWSFASVSTRLEFNYDRWHQVTPASSSSSGTIALCDITQGWFPGCAVSQILSEKWSERSKDGVFSFHQSFLFSLAAERQREALLNQIEFYRISDLKIL